MTAGKPITAHNGDFFITTEKSRLQIKVIHAFLSEKAYWCLGMPLHVVESAIAGSTCFGIFQQSRDSGEETQIGFARVVTDQATFAWVCDVYVEEPFRGKGLSKWLMEFVRAHPSLQNLRRICLATRDAHGLYAQLGFEVTKTPEYWMEIKDNEIYKRMGATENCPGAEL